MGSPTVQAEGERCYKKGGESAKLFVPSGASLVCVVVLPRLVRRMDQTLGGEEMSRPKLESNQFVPQVAPLLLLALLECVADYGVAGDRLCAGLGFDEQELHDGLLVSDRQAWRMIRRALTLSGRSDLGLDVGGRQELRHFGVPGSAMWAAQDLAGALEIGVRYLRQGGGLLDVAGVWEAGSVSLVVQALPSDRRVAEFLVDELFSSLMVLGHILLGKPCAPERVELTCARPAHAARYREMFGVTPTFGQSRNCLVFGRALFEQPLCHHSPKSAARLRGVLERRAGLVCVNAVDAVEQLLSRPGQAGLPLEQVAARLDLSVRTLRRRLLDEGTTFRELSERVRTRMARVLLGERGLSVEATAQSLGFSDARAFRRAFTRWCGEWPARVREGSGVQA